MPDEAFWERMAGEMHRSGIGHDHEDDVQDSLLDLISKANVGTDALKKIRWRVLSRRRVDRKRKIGRLRWRLGSTMDDFEMVQDRRADSLYSHLTQHEPLKQYLGERYARVLLLIIDTRFTGNSGLGRALGITRQSASALRSRIQSALRDYLDAIG